MATKNPPPTRRDFGPTVAEAISQQKAAEMATQRALTEHAQTQTDGGQR